MASELPSNAHVSQHPCLRAKLAQLRSQSTNAREVKSLIHDISLIAGCEALGQALQATPTRKVRAASLWHDILANKRQDTSPLGYDYGVDTLVPSKVSIMPILRSGLGMVDALQTLLPEPVPVHHLGLFRDKTTMTAVEYYNNLPYHRTSQSSAAAEGPSDLAILVDPVVATGASACAAIDTLKEWGVKKIIMICVICSKPGLQRAAELWPKGVEIWAGGMDETCDDMGMIKPGLGDVGDRLFLTIGK
ncbi:MAG: hypothetical protein Q9159_001123 [Coniocarpon cinnabarinum]